MNTVDFIYDGECPICRYAAHHLQIKKAVGATNLIDARTDRDHPLLLEIKKHGYDLDKGMVVHYAGTFYHGREALHFMGMMSSDSGWYNRINARLFKHKRAAYFCYPLLRALRNGILRIKGIGKIDNLGLKDEPVFKSIFGRDWDNLPPVIKKHYANKPYADERVTVTGVLDIEASKLGRVLLPVFKLLNMLVPRTGTQVPTTVHFITTGKDDGFRFDRTLTFSDGDTYRFLSTMRPVGGNELVEVMQCRLGWRMAYEWDGSKVILRHSGYAIDLFGFLLPLPISFLMGTGYAEETPIDDNSFSMMTEIRHPLWGRIYSYKGHFTFKDTAP